MLDVPGYKISREIGRGGMSKVYQALQKSLQRTVALKIMHSHFCDLDEFKLRFIRDGRSAASLNHVNIVNVYDMGIVGEKFYIAMELLEGGTLQDKINKGLNTEEAVQITLCIANALSYAHKEKCIHRDVKPMNILFRRDGTPVLADFGIAKTESCDNRSLTMTGSVLGSPKYMSPEQALGENVDERSDIYNLGVVFYEMLTGDVPYGDTTSAMELYLKHANDPIPSLPRHLKQYQLLIDSMLAKKPEQRLKTAGEVVKMILRLKDHGKNDPVQPSIVVAGKETRGALGVKVGKLSAIAGTCLAIVSALSSLQSTLDHTNSVHIFKNIETHVEDKYAEDQYTVEFNLPIPTKNAAEESGKKTQSSINNEIGLLLTKANEQLSSLNLTSPVGNNAFETFQQILKYDENNADALGGMKKIAQTYLRLAENKLEQNNLKESIYYIRKGLQISPDFSQLKMLQKKVAGKSKRMEKSLLDQAQQYMTAFPITEKDLFLAAKKIQQAKDLTGNSSRIEETSQWLAEKYHNLANQASRHGKTKLAMSLVTKGLEIHPKNNRLRLLRQHIIASGAR
jgi:serine/threonine protein kinase